MPSSCLIFPDNNIYNKSILKSKIDSIRWFIWGRTQLEDPVHACTIHCDVMNALYMYHGVFDRKSLCLPNRLNSRK